jgi:hypothetical protein
MKRLLIALAATALATLSLTGTAAAAPNPAGRFVSTTQSAAATWGVTSNGVFTFTGVWVSTTDGVTSMHVEHAVDLGDGHVVWTGGDATDDVAFTMDTLRFSVATVTANVMVETCTFVGDDQTCGEPRSTLVSVTWTGQGRIAQTIDNHIVNGGGAWFDHTQVVTRDRGATAGGSFGEYTMNPANGDQVALTTMVTTQVKH